jgi:hypothetical protein
MNRIWLLLTVFIAAAAHGAGSNGGGHVVGNPKMAEKVMIQETKDAKTAKESKESKDCDCSKQKKDNCTAGKAKKGAGDCAESCDCSKKQEAK